MAYRIAGIDVHKKMLAVVVSDVSGKHWNGTGSRYARSGKAHARHREPCISRTRYPIGGGGGARRIFWTPNAW